MGPRRTRCPLSQTAKLGNMEDQRVGEQSVSLCALAIETSGKNLSPWKSTTGSAPVDSATHATNGEIGSPFGPLPFTNLAKSWHFPWPKARLRQACQHLNIFNWRRKLHWRLHHSNGTNARSNTDQPPELCAIGVQYISRIPNISCKKDCSVKTWVRDLTHLQRQVCARFSRLYKELKIV